MQEQGKDVKLVSLHPIGTPMFAILGGCYNSSIPVSQYKNRISTGSQLHRHELCSAGLGVAYFQEKTIEVGMFRCRCQDCRWSERVSVAPMTQR